MVFASRTRQSQYCVPLLKPANVGFAKKKQPRTALFLLGLLSDVRRLLRSPASRLEPEGLELPVHLCSGWPRVEEQGSEVGVNDAVFEHVVNAGED